MPAKRDWTKSAAAAERAFAISDKAADQLETVGAKRYLEHIDRTRRQVEGPTNQYVEVIERARKASEGPLKQYIDTVERARKAAEGPIKQYVDMAERARKAAEGPIKQYVDMAERARRAVEPPTRSLVEVVEQARTAIEGPARRLQEHYAGLSRLLDRYDFPATLERAAAAGAQIEKALKQSLPVNWRSLSFEDAEKVERLVRHEGVPLIWVPSAALTAKVVSETTREGVMKILLAEQEAVLRDVEKALDEVTDTDFDVLVEKARKAVAALRDGHGDAAQALAAAVFTTTLHEGLGHKDLADVRKEAETKPPDQATLSAYRGALVMQLASRYVQGRGYELAGFNRSTTLHRVEDTQYTPANNLAAVMAAAGVLREGQARRAATASQSV